MSLYANIGTLDSREISTQLIPRIAQHGTVLAPGTEVAQQRGTGNFDLPSRWEQSTDRGYAFKNAYPIYLESQKNSNVSGFSPVAPKPSDPGNSILADFNTPSELGDKLRKRAYQVGSTGMHSEPLGSWDRPEFQGVEDQYTEWAIKALQMAPNTLLVFFFNKENVNYIQNRIIQEVKRIKGKTINEQSIDELLIIMRNKFAYALNGWLPQSYEPDYAHSRGPTTCSLEGRLTRLNKSVIEEGVKQVLSGIDQYKQYMKDNGSIAMPLDRPTYTSMKGARVLSENVGYNSGHERTLASNSFNERYNIL